MIKAVNVFEKQLKLISLSTQKTFLFAIVLCLLLWQRKQHTHFKALQNNI